MEEELIPINVWLAGRSYRIRVKQNEEEAVRKAVKVADEKVQEMRNHYGGKDDQDFIAMCLLMYAADNATEPLHPLLQKSLQEITTRIDKVLEKDA